MCTMLSNKAQMPMVGLGTFQIKDKAVINDIIHHCVAIGYRLFDTASVYKNEKFIGEVLSRLISNGMVQRKELFITTKLGPKDMDPAKVAQAVDRSLENLQMDYVDLYLIHWPAKQGLKHSNPENSEIRKQVWRELEKIFKNTKKLRAIGVSNFKTKHLKSLLGYCIVKPAVVQNEFHPDYQENDLLKLCRESNIHFQSYSTLGQSRLIADPRFVNLSKKYSKSTAQILLRWAVEKNISVIPKSVNKVHIQENLEIFDFNLNESDITLIDGMCKNEKFAWDPSIIE